MSVHKHVTTIDQGEIDRFDALADTWRDESGPFRALHRINPLRLDFVRRAALRHFGRDTAAIRAFDGLTLLDVGCGGGLVSEPMARMGFDVTALDAAAEVVAAAAAHATEQGLAIDYRIGGIENLAREGLTFDVVLALEIVEHTADPAEFMSALGSVLRPGGLAILSTLNRTAKSFALGIIAAEWVLGWVPRGTHRWKKFLRPSELAAAARGAGLKPLDLVGLTYQPLADRWVLGRDVGVNYLMALGKM